MQLSLSLRRSAALAGAAALLALPQVAAAATEVTLDDSVTATIENAEGVQAHGALDADPFHLHREISREVRRALR